MDITDVLKETTTKLKMDERRPSGLLPREGDYLNEEGCLVCGVCNKPKETLARKGKEYLPIKIPCDCMMLQIAEENRRIEEEREREYQERIENRRKEAFNIASMRSWKFDADDKGNPELSDLAFRYAERFHLLRYEGMGMLLYGSVGTGKTFITACIANKVIDDGNTALVTSFPIVCNMLFSTNDKQGYLDTLNKPDLLVLDDLGIERDTEYMGELIQTVVDSRYRSGKPLIVTTNLTGEELKHPRDMRMERVYSRLFEMCYPYEVKGNDRRKKKLRENSKKFEELIGFKRKGE